ncbi:winged helix-turn-helix transcriptional regulator [Aquabacter spiritensis]|uniref:HxlR family transcriptional regulator n=1 Tax=Aquabacter spiritensis TaxID=933073 RepID=A0A4R3LZT1_9HYPH|nr:helix-turn-helix domain-containing protein [Aquabacter spiritensis]TCT06202.1 HxlR family transcriptional regulator [Aquabacter spiritensis]
MHAPDPYLALCPTRVVLDRIADKWTVLLLTAVAERPMRFNALRRRVEGVSQKVLSQTLKSLERDGLVTRSVFPTVPVTVEYALTPLGASLERTLAPLAQWSRENIDAIAEAQALYDARGP